MDASSNLPHQFGLRVGDLHDDGTAQPRPASAKAAQYRPNSSILQAALQHHSTVNRAITRRRAAGSTVTHHRPHNHAAQLPQLQPGVARFTIADRPARQEHGILHRQTNLVVRRQLNHSANRETWNAE